MYYIAEAEEKSKSKFGLSPTHKLGGVTNYKELAAQIKQSSGWASRQLFNEEDSS